MSSGHEIQPEEERNTGQWTKHPQFWVEDGSIVLRAEKIIFKIHRTHLEKSSEPMRDILKIPVTGDDQGTEHWPILLRGTTAAMFGHFLEYIYHWGFDEPSTSAEAEEKYIDILAIADLWEIKAARKFAIKALSGIEPPLSPARKLQLSQLYTILRWVSDAVAVIMAGKLSELSEWDMECIGIPVLRKLIIGYELKDREIKRTAQVEPRMGDSDDIDWTCNDKKHEGCLATWRRLWWEKIGRRLLHPDSPMASSAVKDEAEYLYHADLSEHCRRDALQSLAQAPLADKRVVADLVEALKDYYRHLSMKTYDADEM
ncbi:hypothetical protein C8F01DRAFT_1077018 [Mycena amicta]|nr:hypothetical protein C8F01DRAFT_1253366 [Mycena amicta]KAJ7070512.1 hypothetical protein C8F01DRAFT_1077018 [Mycena amicta]